MNQPLKTFDVSYWNHAEGLPPFLKRKTGELVHHCIMDLPDNAKTTRVRALSPRDAVHRVKQLPTQKHKPFRLYQIKLILGHAQPQRTTQSQQAVH